MTKVSSAIKKSIALMLSAAMLFCMTACGKGEGENEAVAAVQPVARQQTYSAAPSEISKTETVYVNLNSDGSTDTVTVSDWLHTDVGEVCVKDISTLSNIVNVKSDIIPVIDGDRVQWHMPTTDIYYSGETDKKPPVELKISYYLDGKELSAQEIAGRSGEAEIRVEMKNTAAKTVKINGKSTKVYLPVLVVGGMVLSEADFSGISVENGRAIGDGTKEIVVFFGMPGMRESLGLDLLASTELSQLVMSDTASITAATDCFELGNMYFAVVPLASLDLGIELPQTVEDLKTTLAALGEIKDTLAAIDPDNLLSGLLTDIGSMDALASVVNDAVELYNGNRALINLISKYMNSENGRQLEELLKLLKNPETQKALELLSDPSVLGLFEELPQIEASLPVLASLSKDLQSAEVQSAIESLPETLERLSAIKIQLEKNEQLIGTLTELFSADNIERVSQLVDAIGAESLSSLGNKYGTLADNADLLVARAEKWLEFGRGYGLFTDAADNMKTSVTFVYQTPSIKKAVERVSQEAVEPENESWLASLFSKLKRSKIS